MRFFRTLTTILATLLALFGPSNAILAESNDNIVIKGSTTILPIAQSVASAFEYHSQGVKVQVSGGGSAEGIVALIMGEADIAASSSFITQDEVLLAQLRSVYPVPFRIANDCILPVVHKSNPLRDIRSEDLKKIYRGQLNNWSQLGGPDLEIDAISRDTASGTYDVWHHIIMQGESVVTDLPLKHSNTEVVQAVASNPAAIGYISLGYLNANVKPLKVDGIMGSQRTLLDGSYLINRPLFMFTNSWPDGRTLEFINFVLHPQKGQALIKEAGYIPLY
jgi:phosphate transport system substrate-binding protein